MCAVCTRLVYCRAMYTHHGNYNVHVLEEKGMDGGCFSIAVGSVGGGDTVTHFRVTVCDTTLLTLCVNKFA